MPSLLLVFAECVTLSAATMADMIKSSGIPITMVAASAMAAVPPAIAAGLPPAVAAPPPAIDMEHLSHMTLGERGLEIEVLRLFERQAELLLARMREVGPEGVATLAHTLSGSGQGHRRLGGGGGRRGHGMRRKAKRAARPGDGRARRFGRRSPARDCRS